MATAYITDHVSLAVDKLGTGVTFTKINNITGIQPPQETVGEVDVTHYDSVRAETRAGLADSGSATVDIQFDPFDSDHSYLRSIVGETKTWQVVVPGTQDLTMEFTGFISQWSPNFNARGEAATSQFTIRVTGVVTYELEEA